MASHGMCFGLSSYFVPNITRFVDRQKLMVVLYILYIAVFMCYYMLPEEMPIYVMFIVVCIHGSIEGPISIQLQGMEYIVLCTLLFLDLLLFCTLFFSVCFSACLIYMHVCCQLYITYDP